MSVLVKGMEMPTRCFSCPMCDVENAEVNCAISHGSYIEYREVDPNVAIQDRPSWCPLVEVPEWIPVTERLPEEKGNYLVVQDCWNGAEVHEAFFFRRDNDYGWFDPVEEYEKYNPTHWMPLPEPPKDGET